MRTLRTLRQRVREERASGGGSSDYRPRSNFKRTVMHTRSCWQYHNIPMHIFATSRRNHRYYRISPSVGHTHGTGSHMHLHIHFHTRLHMHPHTCIQTHASKHMHPHAAMPLSHCPRRTCHPPATALTFFRRSPSNLVQRSSKIKSKIEKMLYISSFEPAQHAPPTTHRECQKRLRKSYTSP